MMAHSIKIGESSRPFYSGAPQEVVIPTVVKKTCFNLWGIIFGFNREGEHFDALNFPLSKEDARKLNGEIVGSYLPFVGFYQLCGSGHQRAIFKNTSLMQKVVYVARNIMSGLGLGPLFFLVDIVATFVKEVRNWIDQRSTNPTQTTTYSLPDRDRTITHRDNDPESIRSEGYVSSIIAGVLSYLSCHKGKSQE